MICCEIFRRIDSALLGSVFTLHKANRLVQKKMDECNIEQFEGDERLKHSKEALDATLSLSIERLQRIENKAMGTLLGIAVAIAVFGATSGLLGADGLFSDQSPFIKKSAAFGLMIAMLYLFGSGLLALGGYKIGSIYTPALSDRAPVAEESVEAKVIIYSIEQNQRAAMLRSNRLSASFSCLRNGLLVVIALGMLSVSIGAFSVDEENAQQRRRHGLAYPSRSLRVSQPVTPSAVYPDR